MDYTYIFLIILHGIGAVLGVGGATMSDLMFFKTIRNLSISKTEMKFLELGSFQIWGGIVCTLISSLGLWYFFPELVQTPKVYAKLTIFCILLINGIFLNVWLTPFLKKHLATSLSASPTFLKNRPILFSSGAVSIISWYSVFILGLWRGLPFSYTTIIMVYGLMLFGGVIFANIAGYIEFALLMKKQKNK